MDVKFFLTFLFLFSLGCSMSGIAHDNDDVKGLKPVTLTVRVPEAGVYAISITDKDIIPSDTLQPTIVGTMLDNSAMLSDVNSLEPLRYGFETEQIISGRVKGTFRKIKNPQITVLNPCHGERQQYSLDHHQSFSLLGFDIQEGGSLLLQATRESGKDTFVELLVDEPYFPELSMSKRQMESIHLPLTQQSKQELAQSFKKEKKKDEQYFKEVELDEIVARGKRYKPLNRYRQKPFRYFDYKDDILANGSSMEELFVRMGFQMRMGRTKRVGLFVAPPYSSGRGRFVSPTIYVNDFAIDDDSMNEIWDMSPKDIKQIEYFSGDQMEVRHTLKSTDAGVLCIYTKHTPLRRNPLSMKTVYPLGYRPSRTAYNPLNNPHHDASADHRALLYWNPALVVDSTCKAQVTFMPSLNSRHYNVTLMGIGNTGEISCSINGRKGNEPLSDEQEKNVAEYLENTPREKGLT